MRVLQRKKTSGVTLIELLIVIAVAGVIAAAIYIAYAKVQISNQANTEGGNLNLLRAGIKSMYAATNNYASITNTVVNSAHLTPDTMVNGAGGIVNSFGGAVTILPVNLGPTATNNGFEITEPDVPSAVCSKMVPTFGSQFDQVTVGTTVVKAFNSNTPIDVAAIATACNAATTAIVLFDSL